MDPTQSCTKKRRKIVVDDADRISELGDDLLIHILSLLSTKEAVQTSLLAKRFQNLWAAIPVLDFDFDEFRPDDDTLDNDEDEDEENICEIEEKITKFVDGVFENRDPLINLDSFKLKWDEEENYPIPATEWLDKAAKLNPKFLSVHIFTENDYFKVPDSIFSCESLQEMELHLDYDVISPRSLNLPCLKKVTLHSIKIVDEVMQELSGLPALEDMVLSSCLFNTCDISSGTLKRLVLEGYIPDEISTPLDISISTPNLLYLKILYWSSGRIKFKKGVSCESVHPLR